MLRTLALVLLALALAGCMGNEEGDPPTTSTPGTTTTPEISSTPPVETTPTPPSTPTEPTTAPPATKPAKEVANLTHEFGPGDPSGQNPKKATFSVPEGYDELVLNLTTLETGGVPNAPISVAVSAKLVVLDPEGNEAYAESPKAGAKDVRVPAKPGEWTVRFEGAGNQKTTLRGVVHDA